MTAEQRTHRCVHCDAPAEVPVRLNVVAVDQHGNLAAPSDIGSFECANETCDYFGHAVSTRWG